MLLSRFRVGVTAGRACQGVRPACGAPVAGSRTGPRRRLVRATAKRRRDDDSVDDADIIDAPAEPLQPVEPAALLEEAAVSAQDAVSGAAASINQSLDAAAQAATDVVEDASAVGQAVVGDVSAALEGAAAAAASTLRGDAASPIDWQTAPAGVSPDPAFEGLKVLVVGATGGVGRRVVQALRAKGVACRALVRDTGRAASLLPPITPAAAASAGAPEFEVVRGDVYQYATLPPALKGCNAVVVCSGSNDKVDPLGPFNVDFQGNLNLIAAAKRQGNVRRFVLVTSIAVDDLVNPLNLFGGICWWKKRAEEELQRSGLTHCIVRPGGLQSSLRNGQQQGGIVMERPGTFGFPPFKQSGSILRSQVADVCVQALVSPAAEDKVVEVIAQAGAPVRSLDDLFAGVSMV